MENFANDIAAKMGNILSSKEHQNLFKKASDQTCCNNDCKCGTAACSCKKDKKSCSKSCGSCSSKKEAMQNILSRLLRLSEALDQQGFEKQASTVLKVFAKLHHFDSMQELKHTTLSILDRIKRKTQGSDVVTIFKMIEQTEMGHLLPVIEKISSFARKYKVELPPGFAAGAMNFFEENLESDQFLEGKGENDELNADDSNDLKYEELSKLHSREAPFESLSAEIEELERDPEYEGPIDEGLPISLMERDIEPSPSTMRGGFQRNKIDRFLEGDGEEDELSADDCGDIRLPSADVSSKTTVEEQSLEDLLGEDFEDVEPGLFDDEEFQRFLEGEIEPETIRRPNQKISDTEPARIEVGDFPDEDSPYSSVQRSLREYKPKETLYSSSFMKLDNYFKKNAKDTEDEDEDKKKSKRIKLSEKIVKWLSTAASVVLANSGKRFSEKEQSLFKELSKAAKSGDAKPKHLNKLIEFCEEHKLNVPPTVHELAKTAAYGLFDGDPRGTGTDLEAEDFLDEDDEDEESNPIRKIMLRIYNSSDFQEKLNNEIEPTELSKELAEETAIEMDHPEWLDDPDHEVFDTAYEILEDERFENPEENEYEDF